MKRKFRIKKNEEFQSIIRKKVFLTNSSFVIYMSKKQNDKIRIGISVPKKIGSAVVRNKIKRQIRSMFDSIQYDQFDSDMIVIVRNNYLSKSYSDNENQLKTLLFKISRRTNEK